MVGTLHASPVPDKLLARADEGSNEAAVNACAMWWTTAHPGAVEVSTGPRTKTGLIGDGADHLATILLCPSFTVTL